MNTEERQLAEMLHRVTPEPPRRVTVEDVAFRVASEPQREPRSRRGSIWKNRGWTPVLAALSVFAIAGASAGIATVATSHHSHTPATAGRDAAPPSRETLRVAGGMWGAKLINRDLFSQGSLTGSGDSLYGVVDGSLARIDPATGAILQTAPYSPPVFGRPVVAGNTVWVVWSYGGGGIVLRGYDTRTLAQVASVPVPASGGVSNLAQGVLAAAPDGKLYVAAGDTVATVDPAARQVTHRISLTAGRASSVAVSPDGSKLYVGVAPSGTFQLLVYDVAAGIKASSSQMPARYREPSRDRWRRLGHDGNRDERVGLVRPRWRPGSFLPGQPGRGRRVQFGPGLQRRGGLGRRLTRAHLCQPGHRPRAGAHAHPCRPRRRGVLRQPRRAEQRPHLRPVPGQRGSPGRPGQPHTPRGLFTGLTPPRHSSG